MSKNIIFMTIVLAGSALVGCGRESTSSANVRTAGIAATVEVEATSDSSSTVLVDLGVGGPTGTGVNLESGDRLSAEVGGEKKELQPEGVGEYQATFATGAAGTEFKVLFERDVDEDALNNRGVLPAPFNITGVPADSPSRAMADAVITWDPSGSGDPMTIHVEGSCIFPDTFDVAGDPGTFTIKAGELKSTGGDKPTDCDITVQIERSATGTTDPAFDPDSKFTLKQIRSMSFTSKP
jgi:hypothetical protein